MRELEKHEIECVNGGSWVAFVSRTLASWGTGKGIDNLAYHLLEQNWDLRDQFKKDPEGFMQEHASFYGDF